MKSYQVLQVDPHCISRYSELQVMQSAAGWYIGTTYENPEFGQEPGSRDSDYFPTQKIAELALLQLQNFFIQNKEDWDDTISQWETWLYEGGLDPRRVGYRIYP